MNLTLSKPINQFAVFIFYFILTGSFRNSEISVRQLPNLDRLLFYFSPSAWFWKRYHKKGEVIFGRKEHHITTGNGLPFWKAPVTSIHLQHSVNPLFPNSVNPLLLHIDTIPSILNYFYKWWVWQVDSSVLKTKMVSFFPLWTFDHKGHQVKVLVNVSVVNLSSLLFYLSFISHW